MAYSGKSYYHLDDFGVALFQVYLHTAHGQKLLHCSQQEKNVEILWFFLPKIVWHDSV